MSSSDDSFEKDQVRFERPIVFIIHGYGCCGMAFYKMLGDLRRHCRVITVDMLGMGCSGRPGFDHETASDCVLYFVGQFEAFLRAT